MVENLNIDCPMEYKKTIDKAVKLAIKIYKDNLISLFLAGSVAKCNCIEGWSDIDLYIITKDLNLESNKEFYEKTKKYKIHIGTTFYTKDMINELRVDQKTIAAFYEYHYYNVNEFIYGKIKVPHITYKRLLSTETSINEVIQSVQRELYNYEIDKKNFKTLIKKTVLLMKIYLNTNYHQYTFGYNNVSKKFKEKVDNNLRFDIERLIKTNDKNDELIEQVNQILEDIIGGKNKNMKRVSARGIIITDKGLAVIFRRKINEKGTKEYYVTPGGGIEENENLEEGLKRELREELNIEVNVKDLAFKVETDERIEYFYNCEYVSGNFTLNGEEIDRMSESNYYEPTFIKVKDIEKYDIQQEVKDYLKK